MVGLCILGMASSSLRSLSLLREVVALRRDHQPRVVQDPSAIQGENQTWQDIVDLQCPIQA